MPSVGGSLAGLAAFACAGPTAHALRQPTCDTTWHELVPPVVRIDTPALECIAEQPVYAPASKSGKVKCTLPPQLACGSDSNEDHFSLPPGLPCPLSAIALEKAAAPLGHQGGWLRVRRAMQKLSDVGGNLSIAVLGTSMTEGRKSNSAWARRLEELFGDAGLDVSVRNCARGGSSSDFIIAGWGMYLEPKLKDADLIIVDYTINDAPYRGLYGEALRLLAQLPRRPGVVDLLTFSGTGYKVPMHTDDCAQVDLSTFQHVPVDRDLNIPTISYTEAVCPSGRTFWMEQGEDHDCRSCTHPGSRTHDLIARIVYSVLRGEMEKACRGDLGTDVAPTRSEGAVACLAARPTTSLDAISGTLRPLWADPEWRLYEDAPKKPGWIADEHSSGKSIAFNVTTKVGWIQVEYLGTYENIGSSSVYIDGAEPLEDRTCELHGLWRDKVSLSKFTKMKTRLPAGPHTLTFVGHGMKFKLLGIVAC